MRPVLPGSGEVGVARDDGPHARRLLEGGAHCGDLPGRGPGRATPFRGNYATVEADGTRAPFRPRERVDQRQRHADRSPDDVERQPVQAREHPRTAWSSGSPTTVPGERNHHARGRGREPLPRRGGAHRVVPHEAREAPGRQSGSSSWTRCTGPPSGKVNHPRTPRAGDGDPRAGSSRVAALTHHVRAEHATARAQPHPCLRRCGTTRGCGHTRRASPRLGWAAGDEPFRVDHVVGHGRHADTQCDRARH